MTGGAVLVTGPPRAGVSSMAACLRERMPGVTFVEECAPGAPPAVVIFVVSAVAPIAASDCALAERVTAATDAVIVVLAKIDDHRGWPAVLDAGRARLAGHAARFAAVPWVGAAAAPRLGAPLVDDVVAAVSALLADPRAAQRNLLRRWESGMYTALDALRVADTDRSGRVEALRAHRAALLRTRRAATAQRATTARHPIQRLRLELVCAARERCAVTRAELADAAAEATRADIEPVAHLALRRYAEVIAEVDALMSARLQDLAAESGTNPPRAAETAPAPRFPGPPPRRRHLESRLTTVLGAGFGFGAGLVLARLVSGLVAEHAVAGSAAGAVAGLVLTWWVVRTRAVLHDRAVLMHWIAEAAGAARAALEERIATGMLAAEAELAAARVAAEAAADAHIAERLAACDAQLRELDRLGRRAEAVLGRCEPGLQRALAAVRHGLRDGNSGRTIVTGR